MRTGAIGSVGYSAALTLRRSLVQIQYRPLLFLATVRMELQQAANVEIPALLLVHFASRC